MWTFVVSDRRAGSPKFRSWHTDEVYQVSSTGSWVPTADLEELLRFEKSVCCGSHGESMVIRPISRGNPTADQVEEKPKREPAGLPGPKPGVRKYVYPRVDLEEEEPVPVRKRKKKE